MRIWGIGALFALVACYQSPTQPPQADPVIEVKPTDFALLPCPDSPPGASCAVLAAGGKRLLIGAPQGAVSALPERDWAQIDGVLLFSLASSEIDGLDTVRHLSWTAGRTTPLWVGGPRGVERVVEGVNLAFEAGDALAYINGPPAGSFDSAVLIAGLLNDGQMAFDTGDLTIVMTAVQSGSAGYDVNYDGRTVHLVACGEASASDDIEVCSGPRYQTPIFLKQDGGWLTPQADPE